MKKVRKFLNKKLVSVIAAAAMVLSCFSAPVATQTVQAESEIASLLTDYVPKVTSEVNPESGFTHPGVGLTKTHMETVQSMVRAEKEPWKTYFEYMLDPTGFTSKTVSHSLGKPEEYVFNGAGNIKGDANTVYAQAVMYLVTGDNAYRKNAVSILRAWGQIKEVKWFNEAYIHVGIAMNKMLTAAEIIRYTDYKVTEGYTEADLKWTNEEIQQFKDKMVRPAVKTFSDFEGGESQFMNQHLYSTINAMSGYLFLDDKAGYEKMVEWTTVNKNGGNPGFNGSIARLFRKVTTYDVDENGMPLPEEGTGTPLKDMRETFAKALKGRDYVIQQVEMGRDQAHGCGDMNNAVILARMMQAQKTKVDPVEGTVSTAADAVNIYEFLDHRILDTADFFFEYMLGYDAQWVPVAYSIRDTDNDGDKEIVDFYWDFASGYRGRYQTINFYDVYTYYAHIDKSKNLEKDYKYFFEGFMKKTPTDFYNTDGGADYWLFLPAEAEGDMNYIPEPVDGLHIEIEDRGTLAENGEAMEVQSEGNVDFVHIVKSDKASKIAMTSSYTGEANALRVRTDGEAKVALNGAEVWLPDTDGDWKYVSVPGAPNGEIWFMSISDINGTYVDVDAVDIQADSTNILRTIDIMNFTAGNADVAQTALANTEIGFDFSVVNETKAHTVEYTASGLPAGAILDSATGAFTWTPSAAGTYDFYVAANAGVTSIVKKVSITVFADRLAAINNAVASYVKGEIYVSYLEEAYLETYDETMAMYETATPEEFAAQLAKLSAAVAELELVTPILENDTISAGGSVDYMKRALVPEAFGALSDSSDSFWGNGPAQVVDGDKKHYIVDFGPDYKISVEKFGFMSRFGFPDRVAGFEIHGSNDGLSWETLTEERTKFTQLYQETNVKDELKSNKYRYLRIYKAVHHPEALRGDAGSLLEFAEWRVFGTFYETGNMIKTASMTSADAVGGRIKMGDTVTVNIETKGVINDLSAKIQGVTAQVTKVDEKTYTATAVMASGTQTGDVEVVIDYTKADGTVGDTYYGTSDASSLFLVNSDIFIDVGLLAAELKASDVSWTSKPTDTPLTELECGKFPFDGDINTFVSLKDSEGEYYDIDFGEGVTVTLEEVMFMPRSSQADHASRLNGAIVSGSNDKETWTVLTTPVSGAAMYEWSHMKGKDILHKDAYRYFRVSGAKQGDIAEVEFYGSYNADPKIIADSITKLADQEPYQTQMEYPAIPGGYTISVKNSSDKDIVALGDGAIATPKDDAMVNLVLTVTHTASGNSADTVEIPVKIKGIGSLISGVSLPKKGATALTLPTVPDGFTVTVESSSKEDVVALGDGAITTPNYNTLVDVTFKLVRNVDEATVPCGPYSVLIYGKNESSKIDVLSFGTAANSDGNPCVNLFNGTVTTKDDGHWEEAGKDKYYLVEFEDAVILDKVRFYPRSTKADHAARMNGAHILGSNDKVNWTQITDKVTGASMGSWVDFTAETFQAYGAYKYFKIDGATLACIGEVELYGLFDTTAEKLAAKITSIPDVLASQTSIVMPAVPTGFTVEIASSSNEAVIDKTGKVYVPDQDTTVDLTFKVSGFGDEKTTAVIPVKVQSMAGLVSGIKTPEQGATKLALPEMPEGLTLTISSSSNEAVIAKDGTITTPEIDTLVDIALTLTRKSDGKVAEIPAQPVMVYGKIYNTPITVSGNATVVATHGQWSNPPGQGLSKEEIGWLLFDGNLGTWGDLQEKTGYYTVEFNEGSSVLLDKIRFYPRDDKNYGRLKNTYVEASVDGTNYVPLTNAIAEADVKQGVWVEIKAEDFLRNGAYRFFRIKGAELGDIGEVELFGVLNVSDEAKAVKLAKADLEAALAKMEAVLQKDVADETAAKKAVEAFVDTVYLYDAEATVTTDKFTAAVEGEESNWNGTDGAYSFTVVLNRGEASETTEKFTLVIKATPGKVPVAAPTALAWTGANAGFTADKNAENVVAYEMSLYKDGTVVEGATKSFEVNETGAYSYNYFENMDGSGSYTFKVVAKADPAIESIMDSEVIESAAKAYTAAEIKKGELVASFDFEDLADGVTTVAGNGAKATVEGTAASADSYNEEGKAAQLSNNFWLNVTREDGTGLLAGMNEITISYDSNISTPKASWVFFAAPDAKEQTYKWEKYLGIHETVDATKIMVERYNNNNGRSKAIDVNGSFAGWKHVDVVITATDFSLYVDGEHKQTVASSTQLTDMLGAAGGVLYFGKATCGTGEFCNGLIDNVEIYYHGSMAEDAAPIAAAKTTVEAALAEVAEVAQADAVDEAAAKALVEAKLAGLDLGGVTATVETVEYKAAEAGTITNVEGTDGSYSYKVVLRNKAAAEVLDKAAVIVATEYVPSEEEKALVAANEAIEEVLAELAIPQADATTEAEAKAAIEEAIASVVGEVTAEVITAENGFVAAVEGDNLNEEGTNGSYSFTIKLTSGELAPVTTEKKTVEITATAFDAPAAQEIDYINGPYKLSRFNRVGKPVAGLNEDHNAVVEEVKALTDNDSSTIVEFRHQQNVSPAFVQVDFTENKVVKLASFTVQARQDQEKFIKRVKKVFLAGSNDGEKWEILSASETQETADVQTIMVKDEFKTKAFRYIRLYDAEYDKGDGTDTSFLSISEFHIFGRVIDLGGEEPDVSGGDVSGGDVSSGDAIAVADAKEAVEAAIADIELAQADVANEAAAKAAVQAAVDAAIAEAGMEGVTAVVEGNGYTAPTAGTEGDEDGVDGAYTFIVTLTKGEESDVVAEKTVVITAEAYDAHQHTFSTEWTSDDTYHWHAATCEHTEETLDKAEHTSSDWIVDSAASTTAAGSRHKECTVCEKVLATEEIPQLPGDVTGGITGTVKSFSSDSTVDNTTTIQVIDVSGNVIAQTTVAENEGSYTLTDVSSGDYTVKVSKEDHVTREYSVTVGTEMATLNVEIWLIGDVDGSGDVLVKDKKMIYNHIEGNSLLTDYAFAVGDVDGSGDILVKDKKMIYNHIEGKSLLWE